MAPPLLSDYVRRRRYQAVLPFLSEEILDVGCGHAYLAGLLPPLRRYVGLDISEPLLGAARQRFPQYQFYQWDLERGGLPPELEAEGFSTICLIALLEHLAHPARLIATLATALAPGGRLVATTPTPLGHTVHALGARAGLFYREAAEDHKSRLDRQSLTASCEAAGLRVELHRPFELGCNQLLVARR